MALGNNKQQELRDKIAQAGGYKDHADAMLMRKIKKRKKDIVLHNIFRIPYILDVAIKEHDLMQKEIDEQKAVINVLAKEVLDLNREKESLDREKESLDRENARFWRGLGIDDLKKKV